MRSFRLTEPRREEIAHWAASAATCSPTAAGGASAASSVAASGADPSPALRELAAYLSDDDVGAAETVASVLRRKGEEETSVEGVEAATRVLAAIVASDGIDDANKKRVAAGLAADAPASAASLARVMHGGSGLEARVDAARRRGGEGGGGRVVGAGGRADPAHRPRRREGHPGREGRGGRALVPGRHLRVAARGARRDGAAGRGPGRGARAPRHGGARRVRGGLRRGPRRAVRGRGGGRPGGGGQDDEGRARRRGGRGGRALGGVPPVPGPAAAAAEGGLTRLTRADGCSPAARQMALELLKMYRVNAKSCLAGYDSKTTHIMPF
ncbi:hypothetical protein C2845_PM16G08530 [Panicum miliaceum]|uniref:Uncharacterized protein n=1 Tax=Panicum miliaceum TaxID=4540 RepID=A0A3L6PUI2_PANMI|nr:hypothetical protein C2845_PM16G08530 [Panicum miliaceum]